MDQITDDTQAWQRDCPHCGTELQQGTVDFNPDNEPRAELNPGEMATVDFCPNQECPGRERSDAAPESAPVVE